ncbi:MAG: hypothetical protein C0603_02830 [Denitrovibrio sp.]|nr:MAG: hypothetical protein C0603_02830 [Denitrovibrio sp.]
MIYQEYQPIPKLKDIIRCYWTLNGDAGSGVEYTVIPDYCMDIIFHVTDSNYKSYIAGAGDQYYKLLHKGNVVMFGVRFYPGAFFKLFGIPASKFYNRLEDLDDIGLNIKTSNLFSNGYNNIPLCIQKLNNLFLKQMQNITQDHISDELIHNAKHLNFDHSFLDYYSSKTFNRRLSERCGIGSQCFKNIVRFHKSISLMLTGVYSYSDVAYTSGYYDQAHFIKSFKDHSGFTPTAFCDDIKNNSVQFLQYPLGIF